MALGKVLVVDDETATRRTLGEILRLAGYEVAEAPDGRTALEMLARGAYDVMLLDIRMPGMSGLEVLARVDEEGMDVEVILLTAYSSVESAVAALRHGAVDYLIKPANPDEIIATVNKALQRRQKRLRQRRLLEQLEASLRALKGAEIEGESDADEDDEFIWLTPEVKVDFSRRLLHYREQTISLSPSEARLLAKLLEHEGEVLTHQQLVREVQGYEVSAWEAPEMLRPLVSRLRAKLSLIPGGREWITNVRGVGYVLELPSGTG